MAAEIQQEKPLEELIQNLKVESSSKLSDANIAAAKDGNPSDAISCISSTGDATSSIKESDVDQESLTTDHGMYYPAGNYYGYYYPGYDGSYGEWDDQGYFIGGDGLEFQYPAMQADNGSLIYYMPGYNYNQPGYAPYSPYVPGALIGVDGQYLGQHPYYPNPLYPQQPLTSPGYFPSPVPYGSEIVPAYPWDSSPLFVDGVHGNGFGGGTAILGPKPNLSSPSPTPSPYPKSTAPNKSDTPLETKGSKPASDVPSGPGNISVPGGHNQSLKPVNKVQQHGSGFQTAAVLAKGYFPVAKFPSYSNNHINFKGNGRGWGGTDKLKTRGKGDGINDLDLLNEQNRGPRTNSARSTWVSGVDVVGSQGAEDTGNNENSAIIWRNQYNLSDFPTKYDRALFFVIKSYSEDDIHKSIKYNVWASTPNGNKRLDSAYQDAQEQVRDKGGKCPVFLFFSVNASGQFCGVAEMIGRVDFNKSMDFWQQDKWNGFFPVKWHIIKDIPNPQFRHIILENNDNKPVTNSRDTQEVKLPQGIEMLGIFKNYSSKTSILDDFGFYEDRQKAMQDKRIRPSTPQLELAQHEAAVTTMAGDLKPVIAAIPSTGTVPTKKSKEELPASVVEAKE